MLHLPTALALSGMLALASAQGPVAELNSVCFPSGQLKNTIPYPCPGIARAKDECNKYLPGPSASPEQLKEHRDCLCFDKYIIQFEKGCTACKKTHAFLSERGQGYYNGILDRVNSTYCYAGTPTAAYDAAWASASQAAGPYPTGGADDELINHAASLPADEKTKVELYWTGITKERRPSATAAPTSVSTSATATPTPIDEDDDSCEEETPAAASAGSAAVTTVSPSTAVSGNANPTPVLNVDWIYASAKKEASGAVQPSTVRPPQPSQSGWTQKNETAPASETVIIGYVIIVRVCQKCTYVKAGDDFKMACALPMEVEGTKKQVPVEKAKELPAVPAVLPKEPASVEQKQQIPIPDIMIQQVCGCSYTSGPKTDDSNGSNPGSSKNPGSGNNGANGSPAGPGNAGANGSNPGSSKTHGSVNEGANSANPGSSKTHGSGNEGANGANPGSSKTHGSGNEGAEGANGANGANPGSSKTPGSGTESPKNNGPNGTNGSPAGPGNAGANPGSSKTPGSGSEGANSSNGANGSNPGSSKNPGSGNTGTGSDAGNAKNPGSNGPNNAGSNGVAAPSGSNPSKPTRVGSAGLPSGTNQVPIVSSASGNMPASIAMLFLAAMAILI
ncbi:hypothetical protein J3459_011931 [Metarhizium acridum]|nr:hypothetical protein J3459_011931 [Metarhizium acridum]